MLTASVIIPTYNRPKDLEVALLSILEQTHKPEEILIIDDGNLGRMPMQKEFEDKNIHCIYRKKDTPGLTKSRNLGISLAKGDIILFFDDDVKLMPDYIEKVMTVYEADAEKKIGGISGIILNCKPLSLSHKVRLIYDSFFLVSSFTEGKVLSSGFCTDFGSTPFPIKELMQVDFLMGVAAFRREVFSQFQFSEKYKGYGLGEDKDFSRAIAKNYQLFVEPAAQFYHYESPTMRINLYERGYQFILGRYFFFKDHVYESPWQWLAFWYAITGYTLFRMLIATCKMDVTEWQRVKGIFKAIQNILLQHPSLTA
jgi:glycosyltransferase involved in cell wall biosynthesis